jgi:hypothetical protein
LYLTYRERDIKNLVGEGLDKEKRTFFLEHHYINKKETYKFQNRLKYNCRGP